MTEPSPAPAAAIPDAPASGPSQVQVRSLWRYLRMLGASPTDADDLAQEAFVIALQRGALAADAAATATFLRRTARFLWLRHRRPGVAAVAQSDLVADAVDALWLRDAERDAGEALIAAARACIESLQGRARRAVELGYGFAAAGGGGAGPESEGPASRAAIAAELGLQENGVKTLMQRVRHKLRLCIDRRMER